MYRSIRSASVARPQAVAVAVFEGEAALPDGCATLDKQLGGALSDAVRRAEFKAARGAVTCLYPTKGAERAYLIGLGKLQRCNLDAFRNAAAALVRAARSAELKSIKLHVQPALKKLDALKPVDAARAIGEGLGVGAFTFEQYKGAASADTVKKPLASLTVDIDGNRGAALKRGLTIAESANLARTLAATPPNVASPAYIVQQARKIARDVGLKCSVIDAKRAKELGMGGLTAVGQAGSAPPALIALEWKGKGQRSGAAASKPVMIVGKAITCDTGGYSIKPGESLTGMKYDKCGGMAVLGAMHAVATLKLPLHVVGLVAVAENMIDQGAYRVDDILTMYNGVTVEVTNTDAEGRLILGDALSYGCKTYKPRAVIDLATLTGGVVVALGTLGAGLFVNDDALRRRLLDAADATGERLWELPIWDEHKDMMKGVHGDLFNSSAARREAHPIQGAAFLSFFVARDGDFKKNDPLPWAHLDIAGVADLSKDWLGLYPTQGPTGFGVRLLVRALEDWS